MPAGLHLLLFSSGTTTTTTTGTASAGSSCCCQCQLCSLQLHHRGCRGTCNARWLGAVQQLPHGHGLLLRLCCCMGVHCLLRLCCCMSMHCLRRSDLLMSHGCCGSSCVRLVLLELLLLQLVVLLQLVQLRRLLRCHGNSCLLMAGCCRGSCNHTCIKTVQVQCCARPMCSSSITTTATLHSSEAACSTCSTSTSTRTLHHHQSCSNRRRGRPTTRWSPRVRGGDGGSICT